MKVFESAVVQVISSLDTNLQQDISQDATLGLKQGVWPLKSRTGLITLLKGVLPCPIPCVKLCSILGEIIRSLVKRGQIQVLFRTLSFGISLKVADVVSNSLCIDDEIKWQQLSVRELEDEQCPELSHRLVKNKTRIADGVHPLKVIVATMIFMFLREYDSVEIGLRFSLGNVHVQG